MLRGVCIVWIWVVLRGCCASLPVLVGIEVNILSIRQVDDLSELSSKVVT